MLCWLVTVDAEVQPNFSPKEVWTIADDQHVVVAHIASPISARNIARHPQVCLNFADVFVQKGFKLVGTARAVHANDAEFTDGAEPLLAMVDQRFTIQSVLVVHVKTVATIVAPSYRFYPNETTETSQVASGMRTYNVQAVEKKKP